MSFGVLSCLGFKALVLLLMGGIFSLLLLGHLGCAGRFIGVGLVGDVGTRPRLAGGRLPRRT